MTRDRLADASSWCRSPYVALGPHTAHVWRIALDDATLVERYWPLLDAEEQGRARRFHRELHRTRYVIAHGALRRILAGYVGDAPQTLEFVTGAHGKPSLRTDASQRNDSAPRVEFNLSHSDDLALVAVAHDRPIGVDVERWSEEVEHLELAERFFSPAERLALRALAHDRRRLVQGFFAAWSRKEAYLKATGAGITRGLHHFDVTLTPDEPARLVADRLDASAPERWMMTSLVPSDGYSAAVVVAAPLREVLLFDGDAPFVQHIRLADTSGSASS